MKGNFHAISNACWPDRSGACQYQQLIRILLLAMVFVGLGACSSDDEVQANDPDDTSQFIDQPDGDLQATIRRTTNGVPHVLASNLESVAFGAGFAQSEDNICQLAESIVKARSERAKFFGPGERNLNIVNDFSYQALRIRSGADADYDALSAESRALIDGFTAGINQYVEQTASNDLPPQCRNQAWVRPISPLDLLAHYRLIAQYASGNLFADGAVFLAVPPGAEIDPVPVVESVSSSGSNPIQQAASTGINPVDIQAKAFETLVLQQITADAKTQVASASSYTDADLGSNAWGIGSEMSEQGRGALLANPHFPYTGARRFYQMHMTVPGYLDVNGAALSGVAIPLIGFNQNVAWSHTVSSGRRFTAYELSLKEDDDLVYIKDGQETPITVESFEVEVANGTPTPTRLTRNFYFSEYGPMLPADELSNDQLGAWGDNRKAYTYKDANASVSGLLDTWLGLSRASNLDSFQQVFRDCGSTLWTNTTYADDQGNAYYIDSSSVPQLSEAALQVIETKRNASPLFNAFFEDGFTLLDGSTSRDDWVEGPCGELVPFDSKPQLTRQDFVQNSNDSHWASNPAALLEGYSPLFGAERSELSARTRLGLTMLLNPTDTGLADSAPAGQDGKFSAQDLIDVIYNNRSFHAETLLPELRERCTLIGDAQVNATAMTRRNVVSACASLAGWNGTFDTQSVGAHVFRVFMAQYVNQLSVEQTVVFDPASPVATPSTPGSLGRGTASDPLLSALARASNALDSVNVPYDATLGTVQSYRASGDALPGGTAQLQGDALPWHGATSFIDGGFNAIAVTTSAVAEDTVFPRIGVQTIPSTGGLSSQPGEYWQIGRGTSWHFGLEFTDIGPVAFGLLSYSQSTHSNSPFFLDQSQRYSQKDYRPLLFREEDIIANLLPDGEMTVTGPQVQP